MPSENLVRRAAIEVAGRQEARASLDQPNGSLAGESTPAQELLHEFKPSPPRDSGSTLPASECLGVYAQLLRENTE